nr:MAG TPA: Protein of unknown function (DUF551) [Bacteriophage sp.]
MERLTYVTEKGEVLFHPEDLLDDVGMTITQLAKDGRFKALEIISERLANYEQVEEHGRYGKWIPVSERPPEELVPVNVTWINRNPEPYYAEIKDVPFACTAVYYNGKWYWWSSVCTDYLEEYGEYSIDLVDEGIDIVAWMPLPEPYRESKEDHGK